MARICEVKEEEVKEEIKQLNNEIRELEKENNWIDSYIERWGRRG